MQRKKRFTNHEQAELLRCYMAIKTLNQNPRKELESLLDTWEARWRFKTMLLYLPRVLLLAFSLGILAIPVLLLLRLLTMNAIVTLLLLLASGSLITIGLIWSFYGNKGIEAARKFDNLFGLQERLATAFELLDGRIKTVDELADLQISDTLHNAQSIEATKMIRLEWRKWEWAGAITLGFVLTVFLTLILATGLLGQGRGAATDEAIAAAASTAQDVTELVATDDSLSPDERQSLLDSAEMTLSELQNPDTTAEDAFAAMSDLEADLSAQADSLREDIAASENAMNSASESLSSPENADANQLGQQLSDISNSLNNMSDAERAEMAQNLEEAADALEEENPELAQNLDAAAEALRNGDTQEAAESLVSASQTANSAAAQNAENADTAEALDNAASQAQQAAQDIATSEFNENAQPEGEIDPNSTIEEQLGMESPDIASMPGEDGGGGSGDEPSEGAQGDLVESDDPNARPADTEGNSEMQGEQQEGSGRGETSNAGSGAGDGEGPKTDEVQGGSSQNEVSGDNDPSGEGESVYDEVYAPIQESSTSEDNSVILESSEGEQPAIEGEFQENPTGESSVPYNQVFANYADAANRALENAYVPLGLRDVVRDYFTSIEPTGDSQP